MMSQNTCYSAHLKLNFTPFGEQKHRPVSFAIVNLSGIIDGYINLTAESIAEDGVVRKIITELSEDFPLKNRFFHECFRGKNTLLCSGKTLLEG